MLYRCCDRRLCWWCRGEHRWLCHGVSLCGLGSLLRWGNTLLHSLVYIRACDISHVKGLTGVRKVWHRLGNLKLELYVPVHLAHLCELLFHSAALCALSGEIKAKGTGLSGLPSFHRLAPTHRFASSDKTSAFSLGL